VGSFNGEALLTQVHSREGISPTIERLREVIRRLRCLLGRSSCSSEWVDANGEGGLLLTLLQAGIGWEERAGILKDRIKKGKESTIPEETV